MPPICLELYQHALVWDSPWSFLYISLINSMTTGSRLDAEKQRRDEEQRKIVENRKKEQAEQAED